MAIGFCLILCSCGDPEVKVVDAPKPKILPNSQAPRQLSLYSQYSNPQMLFGDENDQPEGLGRSKFKREKSLKKSLVDDDIAKAVALSIADERRKKEEKQKEDEFLSQALEQCFQEQQRTFTSLFDENEALRSNSENILMLNPFKDPRIFYVRSIRQPNGWLCGYFALFNAWMIENCVEQPQQIPLQEQFSKFFSPVNYNFVKFKEFYDQSSVRAYAQKGLPAIQPDFYSEEICKKFAFQILCPSATNENNINYLENDGMGCVWENLHRSCNESEFYFLCFVRGSVQDLRIDKVGTNFSGSNIVEVCNVIKDKIINDKSKITFFFCNTGDHWFLVAILNYPVNPSMIIMDSLNRQLHETNDLKIVIFLKQQFLDDELEVCF
ncbi:MAG: hypothetical protein UR14_C0007G0015 [candidate division TM6 bacterium GW2011_GWE2_31_21]|nr:MAG: hypothetical protein UR14_C0007G0015 [candidate division TM6 bacterium GW2011_GWE2_31_21]KKP53624.1 MAG: hypothetical protein UR43_C0004G0165 [candidate division TM6 bacterium GW2011_GWF2_33_332]